MNFYRNFLWHYRMLALILLNTCAFLLFLNICLFVLFQVKDSFFSSKKSNPIFKKYGDYFSLKKVYPDLNEEALNSLLGETWSRPFVYEPFTHFKERPYTGDYVNVDKNGFRITKNQGPWPPNTNNYNIFLFGGSTTFGYGVPDNQTVASYLQEALSNKLEGNICVYNFGRGHYYSRQERILFESLLVSCSIPDIVIFIDGMNEFLYHIYNPLYTGRIDQFDKGREPVNILSKLLNKLPMTRAVKTLKYQLKIFLMKNNKTIIMAERERNDFFNEDIYNDETIIISAVDRYLKNKEIIEAVSAIYDIKPIFIWQPVPTYKYDVNYHSFVGSGFNDHSYSRYGYQYMAELIKEKPLESNFLWCADIQENLKEPLYVDKVHYSAKMSKMLAVTIANLLLERKLLAK